MLFRGTLFGLFNAWIGNKVGVSKVGRVINMHLPSVPAWDNGAYGALGYSQLSCNAPRINREKIWKQQVGVGINFEYGLPNLLHLRFAEDILLFGRSADKIIFMFDSLMGALAEVGLILKPWGKHNLDKRNSTANPPSEHWECRT